MGSRAAATGATRATTEEQDNVTARVENAITDGVLTAAGGITAGGLSTLTRSPELLKGVGLGVLDTQLTGGLATGVRVLADFVKKAAPGQSFQPFNLANFLRDNTVGRMTKVLGELKNPTARQAVAETIITRGSAAGIFMADPADGLPQ